MVESIKSVLMERDGMSESAAEELISDARADLNARMNFADGYEDLFDFCEEWFGLEPDYLDELLYS